jgi:hypothetical protein
VHGHQRAQHLLQHKDVVQEAELCVLIHDPKWRLSVRRAGVHTGSVDRDGLVHVGAGRCRVTLQTLQPARQRAAAVATKVLGWPKRRKLAHAFLWEYSYKRLKLAQLLGQLGVFLTRTRASV